MVDKQVQKTFLEEVQELEMAPCGACTGWDGKPTGLASCDSNQMGPGPNGKRRSGSFKRKGGPRSSWPRCAYCHGEKAVFLNHICECGMPAVLYDKKDKVWSCGDKSCIGHAVWRRNFGSAPMHGYGIVPGMVGDDADYTGYGFGG